MRVIDYINQGGPIMYILLLFNIIGFATIIYKIITIAQENKKTDKTTDQLAEMIKNSTSNNQVETMVELSKQELTCHMNHVESGINTIKIIASISPLIGLLGTVIGVLVAFRVMSETGLNNPSNFAEGISMALITTVGGLLVAIPHFMAHSYLLGMLDKLEANLEKKLLIKLL